MGKVTGSRKRFGTNNIPFLRKLVSQFWTYRAETFAKIFFILQVVYKSEPKKLYLWFFLNITNLLRLKITFLNQFWISNLIWSKSDDFII